MNKHIPAAHLQSTQAASVWNHERNHVAGTWSGSCASRAQGTTDVSAKRYRYTGKERDEETGFTYHGARYYAPWLGGWMSADPIGLGDGTNVCAYVRGNPLKYVDPTGRSGWLANVVGAAREVAEKTLSAAESTQSQPRPYNGPRISAAPTPPPNVDRQLATLTNIVRGPFGALSYLIGRGLSDDQGVHHAASDLGSIGDNLTLAKQFTPKPGSLRATGSGGRNLATADGPKLGGSGETRKATTVSRGQTPSQATEPLASTPESFQTPSAATLRHSGNVAEPVASKGGLSNQATRSAYHEMLDAIPGKIEGLPLKEQALKAFQLRNEAKLATRRLMADQAAAEALPQPATLADMVRKAYRKGLVGDDVWRYIQDASIRSNPAVDAAVRVPR
jgi:RHS repeat-associated protein